MRDPVGGGGRSHFSPRKAGRAAPVSSSALQSVAMTSSRIGGTGPIPTKPEASDFRAVQRSWFAHPDDDDDDGVDSRVKGSLVRSVALSSEKAAGGAKATARPTSAASVTAPIAAAVLRSGPALEVHADAATPGRVAGQVTQTSRVPVAAAESWSSALAPAGSEVEPAPSSLTFRQRQALLRAHLEQD